MGRKGTPDQQAEALAAKQLGAISRRQALACGLTANQITSRVATGRWWVVLRGVYGMAGVQDSWQLRARAACLAGPEGTVASHLTAAALVDLAKPPREPHVTVPPSASGRFAGAVIHCAPLTHDDLCTAARIPATRPARTVVDCAAILTYEALCEMVDDLLCRSPHTPAELRAAMDRASRRPGRNGSANLERALEVWTPGARPGSRAEMRLVRQLQAWGFPIPERQLEIRDAGGRLVATADVGYRNRAVVLEYYGERHHGPRAEAHDTRRLRAIEATGYTVIVVTKENLRSPALRAQLTRCVGQRPSPDGRDHGATAA